MDVALLEKLASNGGDYSAIVESALQALLDIGFERSRFYQVATDPFTADGPARKLFLFSAKGHESDTEILHYPIPWEETTLFAKGQSTEPAIDTYEDSDAPWVVDLDMAERTWIDIPVVCGGKLIGLIAADVVGGKSILQSLVSIEDSAVLGRLVGACLQGPSTPSVAVAQAADDSIGEREDTRQIIFDAVDRFARANNIATATVFEYSWTAMSLGSIHRFVNPTFGSDIATAPEERYGLGEFLTGRAFLSEEFDRVPNFETIQEASPELVAPDSLSWHTHLLGRIQTVSFAKLGRYEQRFLVRLINSASRPRLPFFSEHRVFLEAVAELAPLVDGSISRTRVAALEEMGALIASDPPLDEVLRVLGNGLLASELIFECGVVAHRSDIEGFVLNATVTNGRVAHLPTGSYEWKHDQRYSGLFRKSGPSISFVEAGGASRSVIARGRSDDATLAVRFQSGNTAGALLIPIRPHQTHDGLRGPIRGLDDLRLGIHLPEVIRHAATLVGQAVESSYRVQQAQGAIRALGLVGHEMATPVARLGSSAQLAIDCGLGGLAPTATDEERAVARSALNQFNTKVGERREDVRAAIALGRLVARDAEGKLLVEARTANLGSTVLRAVKELRRELELTSDLPSVVCDLRRQVRDLPRTAHDPHLLRAALLNLMRNAAKYSDANHRVVEVGAGRSAGWHIVWVRNRGRAIPDELQETMFEPFVRGVDEDPELARRGMGLGLFLSRRIARAHGGDILLIEHEEEQGATERRRAVWRTQFELRIPDNLAAETYLFAFGKSGGGRVPRLAAT